MSSKKREKCNSKQKIVLLLYKCILENGYFRFIKPQHYVCKRYLATHLSETQRKEKWGKKLTLFWCHFYIKGI